MLVAYHNRIAYVLAVSNRGPCSRFLFLSDQLVVDPHFFGSWLEGVGG